MIQTLAILGSYAQALWGLLTELWLFFVIGFLLAGAAVELCSEGFSIFAGQLHHMGATLAVVFVVALVGVTTDFTELSVIFGKFGKRCMFAYLLIATALTLAFGLTIQWLFE